MTKGKIISFEGPDGAGKTTVLEHLVPILRERSDCDIVTTREPGGVEIAERIREVILNVSHTSMDDKTELLLYMAARRQHYVEKVLPALEAGKLVLIDRFIDSSLAYQGAGRGLDDTVITWLNDFVTDGRKPDLTLYFDVDAETGLARIAQNAEREVNRLDLEKVDMHRRVRQGYLKLAEQDKERVVTLDATQNFAAVLADALKHVQAHLKKANEE